MDVTRLVLFAALLLWGLAHVVPSGKVSSWRHWWRWQFPIKRKPALDVGELVTEVATRLRSGLPATAAWDASAARAGLPLGISGSGFPAALEALPRGSAAAGAKAAWQLAGELGAPLADTLDECAIALAHSEENEAARSVALAGPAASARLLALLPLLGLMLGTLLGTDPGGQLMGGGIGTLAGVLGAVLYGSGIKWSQHLLRAARGPAAPTVDTTVLLALVRASIRSGAAIPRALESTGTAIGAPDLIRASRLLLLGAAWQEAWEDATTAGVTELSHALEPAWIDGADPIPLLERAAASWQLRRDRRAREAAARLGVRLVMPLALCYLPAFVLIGVLPIVLGTSGGLMAF